jgi:cholesterol oxidase
MTLVKDVMILSGSGVGGGSLVYAQTLYRAGPRFFADCEQVSGEAPNLDPYCEEAERMLGAVTHPRRTPPDQLLIDVAADMGAAGSFHPARVGVYFGEPGVTVPDPYFDGDGPPRAGCVECGQCLLGCRYNAKNTLPNAWLRSTRSSDWLAVSRCRRVALVSVCAFRCRVARVHAGRVP